MSNEKGYHAECKQLVRRRRYAFGIIYDPKTDLNISISFNEYTGCNVILTKNNTTINSNRSHFFGARQKNICSFKKRK
jgi:hypothetical protein